MDVSCRQQILQKKNRQRLHKERRNILKYPGSQLNFMKAANHYGNGSAPNAAIAGDSTYLGGYLCPKGL